MATHGPVSSSRVEKVAQRLRKRIEDGEFYEGLQTYKALYSRYRAQGKEQQAVDLVYEGAVILLEHSQWECGNELALIVIKFHKEKKSPITKDILERISRIFHLYSLPPQTAVGADSISLRLNDLTDINPREQFVRAALKWSHMVGESETCKYGHPEIHQMVARQYWKEKQYLMSADHFLYAEDPDKFADMLVEFSSEYGHAAERDLFIVRAVLQLMVLNNPRTALRTYHHYVHTHPHLAYLADKQPPFEGEPSLNFAWFLLHSAVYLKEFTIDILGWIKSNYSSVIKRDPSFSDYMDKIGVVYCGVDPPKKPEGGIGGLEGIFDSLLSSFSGAPPEVKPEVATVSTEKLYPKTVLDTDDALD